MQPILDRYVRRLQGELEGQGFKRDLLVMNGNGGTVAARLVAREAAKTIMSGPASGVMAAAATLAQSGVANAITYDMGGTSTDVALIHGGVPQVSSEIAIDYGLPIHVPMVDVQERRRRRRLDRLDQCGGACCRSGRSPRAPSRGPSATAAAGPSRPSPTPTSCSDGSTPSGLLAVSRPVTVAQVRDIFAAKLAKPLGLERRRGGRGRDPARQHAHGRRHPHGVAGARPRSARFHAVRLRRRRAAACRGAGARARALPEVLVPARPGLTNALGCLVADLRQDFVNTLNVPLDAADMGEVHAILAAQRERGIAVNAEEQSEIVETIVLHGADMQFRGQTHLIRVALPARGRVARGRSRRCSRRPISRASRCGCRRSRRCWSTSSRR